MGTFSPVASLHNTSETVNVNSNSLSKQLYAVNKVFIYFDKHSALLILDGLLPRNSDGIAW